MTVAALGSAFSLETLDGERSIDLRPGVQSGQTETLLGLGVTHLRGQGRGDVIVHVDVQTPTRLDPDQEELMRKLAALRGEDGPEVGTVTSVRPTFFTRLRDAFNDN